ncbi:MAG TPA: PAS domain-containing protein [Sphingobium sp.]
MSVLEMIRGSAVAAIITNPRAPDNPIIACNAAFESLTGYDATEVIGRNCRFLGGADTDPATIARLREAIAASRPIMVELLNYRRDGTPFRNAVMIAPLFDDQGDLQYFLGSQIEIAPLSRRGHDEATTRLEALTRRQREVLLGMAAGKSSKQIAFDLTLTERTIKMHRGALIRALGVRSAVEAIRIAVEAGH